MSLQRIYSVAVVSVVVLSVVGALGVVGVHYLPALTWAGAPSDHANVTVVDENGTRLGAVDARVVDTRDGRYRGLSGVESLPRDAGMLFVFEDESVRHFVMRDMNFPLDMIFVDANGTVTAVHHAPLPPANATGGDLETYSGRAKWVLEVNAGWATRHDVTAGDELRIQYDENATWSESTAPTCPTATPTATPVNEAFSAAEP